MLDVFSGSHSRALSTAAFITDRRRRSKRFYLGVKRVIDILATLAMAPVVLPLLAILAVLVKLDGGKAFYGQPRLGKDGKVFTLWKLRSMQPDADRRLEEYLRENLEARIEWERTQKLRNDPRITTLGRYIRKYSLDELPQLLNVFLGHMSLVGPRPMLPQQRKQYPGSEYFRMRPGLTGLWQISDRNNCSFAERAMHDNRYAAVMSLAIDFRILAQTPLVVLRGTGM
ncbi:Sugar transferase involved in LPS biosynthesis (colanic, teichoic acid) [Mesorhizobium albiziae]|uniref:Sugar transferase involved in LPS biosynthesis (Colanic, teichoic acid) n=1 Tax=Neomesorhizobium albiziae TaxID=335020 RepID=A0A1I3XK20_9HYPH|nr:sugar transferase [Mesorhizobium albiziae]GLS30391.1 sugar transferase [Mesorhizobium albiziae]SFK19699.1 Sugar transferase involved in LPS biosynthesis (colanic, teichoic acid) [Mesorhizobium albiziae]